MPIEFLCSCGQRLKVADTNAGKRAKCPKCKAELRIPEPALGGPAPGNGLPSAHAEPERYAGRPLLLLLDNYVLDAIGKLPADRQRVTSEAVQTTFGGGADWKATLRSQLGISDELDEHLKGMWKRNQQKAQAAQTSLAPLQFAKMVVDENFAHLIPDAREAAAGDSAAVWTVQTGEGSQYGPITKAELDGWLAEGRLDENCQLLCEGWEQWKWANEVYPSLGGSAPAPASDNPFDFSGSNSTSSRGGSSNPYSAPKYGAPSHSGASPSYSGHMRPHRGQTIKILGILSFVINPCLILSIMAWTMGNSDLQDMRMGRMDPSGRADTEVGRMCGIISLSLSLVVIVVCVLFVVLVGGAAAIDAGGR